MKKVLVFMIIAIFLISLVPGPAYAGWKENYRTKYSKKTLDANSEKAKKIKRLSNLDCKFLKWKRTAEERKAMGIKEPATTLSGSLMPWRRRGEKKDFFEGYAANFSPGRIDLPKDDTKPKSGRTLTGLIKDVGQYVGTEADRIQKRVRGTEEIK
ncbi:MAG: hypothetical protein ISS34_01740 [Candidatus Omnitrophica bacterium]|nr:hypothetical protein [Candidatus Omnitrophota bacterium]